VTYVKYFTDSQAGRCRPEQLDGLRNVGAGGPRRAARGRLPCVRPELALDSEPSGCGCRALICGNGDDPQDVPGLLRAGMLMDLRRFMPIAKT